MGKKFDVIIGNPPYQEEAQGAGTRDTPVYHLFMDAAYEMGKKVVLVTLEEASAIGGAGAACAERIAMEGLPVRVLRLGLPDVFIGHGDRSELLALRGLDAAGIVASIRMFVEMH